MADKKISQLPNLDRVNYTPSDLLLINHGLAPYSSQTTSNTSVVNFMKYYTGTTNYITGVTFSLGILTMYVNGTLQTIPVTGLTSTYLTGGTYSKVLSAMTFTNNTGGTFNVTGMYFPKVPSGTLNSIQYNNNQRFSGNTLIYNSGTTSIYNRGYNGITGNTFYGEDAGGKTSKSGQTVFGAFSYSGLSSSGNYNELFGGYTLSASTTATYNSFFGYGRGRNSTTINNTIGFGSNPSDILSTETQSVFVGYGNISYNNYSYPSPYSVAVGAYSQIGRPSDTTSSFTSIGFSSLRTPNSRGVSVAIGSRALYGGSNSAGLDLSTIIGCNNSQGGSYPTYDNTILGSNSFKNMTAQRQTSVVIGNDFLVNRTSGNIGAITHIGNGKNSYYIQGGNISSISLGVKLYPSGSTYVTVSNFHTIGYNVGSSLRLSTFIGNNTFCFYGNRNPDRCVIFGNNIAPISTNTLNNSGGDLTLSVLGNNIFTNNTFGSLTDSNMIMGNYISHTPTLSTIQRLYAIGYMTAYNTYSGYNLIIGNKNSYNLTAGTLNTLVGNESFYNSSNNYNASLGYKSGYSLTGTTNDSNTFIGTYAGSNLKGGLNNTIIGYSAQASTTIVSNEITLGNSLITSLRCNVTSITSLSDLRDKKDINKITSGLEIINDLNPVMFSWDTRDKTKIGVKSSGFIAQEVLDVEEKYNLEENFKLVYKSNLEKLEISSWNILPIMVKSLQDLSKKNKELKERIKKLTI